MPDVRRLTGRTMTPALADVIARTIMRERDTITRALQSAGVAPGDVDDVCQYVVLVALAAAQEGRMAWQHRASSSDGRAVALSSDGQFLS